MAARTGRGAEGQAPEGDRLTRATLWADLGAAVHGFPQPPATLAPHVRQLGPERWGTRERAPGLRGLGWFEEEFLDGAADDYVLAGTAGSRTEEPSLQYLLVHGRLGLFVNAPADARGHAALQDAADVQELGSIALGDGPLAGDGRLSVLHNAYSTRRWRWTGRPESGGLDGLEGALDWLRRL